MSWTSKVIWSEGMFLQPQHFQQQDRYVDRLLEGRIRPLLRNAWGFSSLQLDTAALSLGKLQISSAVGVMPDGTPFDIPALDPAPLAIDIDPQMRDEMVVLALPIRRTGTVEVASPEGDVFARLDAEEAEVLDSAGAGGTAVVQTGNLRLRLIRERDAGDGYCKLAVAQVIERKSDNSVLLSKDFIPPALANHASSALLAIVADIQGRLNQLGDAIASSLGQPGRAGAGEVVEFLMLQTVNRYQTVFSHLRNTGTVHPEELFTWCLQLAGDLAIFSPNTADQRRPQFLIDYKHDDLRGSFTPVLLALRTLLAARPEKNAIPIDLQEKRFGVRVAVIADLELLHTASFILAVHAQVPTETLRSRFVTQTKIGPAEKIRELVNLQLPGVSLMPLAVAPRQVPFHAGFAYFELERGTDLWKHCQKSGSIAMHVAGDFPGLEMALWAVRA